MRHLSFLLLSVVFFAMLISPLCGQDSAPPETEIDADSFREWLEFISPSEDELAYETIGWRNAFWPAVEEARKLGRPILLWTMNGHPLGCT